MDIFDHHLMTDRKLCSQGIRDLKQELPAPNLACPESVFLLALVPNRPEFVSNSVGIPGIHLNRSVDRSDRKVLNYYIN